VKKTLITRKVGKKKQHTSMFNKEEVKTETLEEFFSGLKSIKTAKDHIFDYIDSSVTFFEDYLKEKELPHIYPKCYEYEIEGSNGGAHLPEILKYITQDKGIKLQPEWYAASFIQRAHELREWIEKGDIFEAVQCALHLEKDRSDFNLSNLEPKILAGKSRVSEASKMKMKTATKNQSLAKPIFNSFIEKDFSKSRAALHTAKRLKKDHGINVPKSTILDWRGKKLI
jgi:hypothetical protein|tara:strand:- start:538 stop:1218 length:681 start_codon:yes stop_codon:yes gene_type:complete